MTTTTQTTTYVTQIWCMSMSTGAMVWSDYGNTTSYFGGDIELTPVTNRAEALQRLAELATKAPSGMRLRCIERVVTETSVDEVNT
jgi:hypothetical protein